MNSSSKSPYLIEVQNRSNVWCVVGSSKSEKQAEKLAIRTMKLVRGKAWRVTLRKDETK